MCLQSDGSIKCKDDADADRVTRNRRKTERNNIDKKKGPIGKSLKASTLRFAVVVLLGGRAFDVGCVVSNTRICHGVKQRYNR